MIRKYEGKNYSGSTWFGMYHTTLKVGVFELCSGLWFLAWSSASGIIYPRCSLF